jgi:O-antigen/teichoic acid export membrane protein
MTDPATPGVSDRSVNIVRGIGSLSAQAAFTTLFGFALLASLLRFLSYTSYSAYASLQVSVGIGYTLGIFGLNYAVVKFLAPDVFNEKGSGWGAAKASIILVTSFSGTVSVAIAAAAPYLANFFMKSSAWSWIFYSGALWLFSSTVASTLLGVLQAVRRYRLMAGIMLTSRFLAVAVAIVALILYQSLEIAILSWVLYYGVLSVAVLLLFLRPLIASDSRPHYRPILRYAAPLGLAGIVTGVTSNADIVVVGGYLNPLSLGVYNATVVVSSVVSALLLVPLTTALFAETSFSSETPAEVSKGTALALRFSTVTILPASLFAAAVASQLFDLFSGGGAYAQGIPYLQLITIFYFFYAVQSVAIFILQAVGKTREVLIVGIITALGEIGLSLSLVPGFGLAGAAASRVTIMAAGCALSLYFLRSYLKGSTRYSFLAKALLSSVVTAASVLALSTFVSNRVLSLLPYSVIGVLLYLGCARVLKLFNDEDRSFVVHLLPESLQWVVRML